MFLQDYLKDDGLWFSVYVKKPKEGQRCLTKFSGRAEFNSFCVYENGYFVNYQDFKDRVEITRWKHDLWIPFEIIESEETC